MSFILPPRLHNERGEIRRVGFELEFGGIELETAAVLLRDLFGGRITRKNRFALTVADTAFGNFEVESDSRLLKEARYAGYLERIGLSPESGVGQSVESLLASFAGTLVPFEIATPPIPMDRLDVADSIRQRLQKSSATGTRASIFTAFGMQLNPEVPDRRAETLLAYLRSFFLLFDWLFEESEIVLARRIAPFINDFPQSYVDLILDLSYEPNMNDLMDDYLRFNPTRNRPLDMLPLFAEIDRDKVMSCCLEKDLVKARPTFHYRLPNSLVDDPHWTIAREWNRWIEIEKLASRPKTIALMCEDYFVNRREHAMLPKLSWARKTREWLHERSA